MEKISAENLKSMQLEMLKFIDDICTKYNLRYYAAYGTLLGAIRHKGFIPWDDDIDLYMHRDDVIGFSNALKSEKSPYKLITMNNTDHYYHPFIKLSDIRTILIENNFPTRYEQGIYIDIFILDNLPQNKQLMRKQYKKCHRRMITLYTMMNNVFPKGVFGKAFIKSVIVWVYTAFIQFFGLEKRFKIKYEKIAQKYNFDCAAKVFPECKFYTELYEKSTFEKYRVADFENMKIRIPDNYEDCLAQCYGDYMQLPPEEQRVATHASTAYWKD